MAAVVWRMNSEAAQSSVVDRSINVWLLVSTPAMQSAVDRACWARALPQTTCEAGSGMGAYC